MINPVAWLLDKIQEKAHFYRSFYQRKYDERIKEYDRKHKKDKKKPR